MAAKGASASSWGKSFQDAKGGKKGKAEVKGKTSDAGMAAAVNSLPVKGKDVMRNGVPSPAAAGHAADTAGKGAPLQKGKGPSLGAAAGISGGKGKDGKDMAAGHAAAKGKGHPLEFTAEAIGKCVSESLRAIQPLPGRWTEDGQPMVQLQIGRQSMQHLIQAAERFAATLPASSEPTGDSHSHEPSKSLPEPAQDANADQSHGGSGTSPGAFSASSRQRIWSPRSWSWWGNDTANKEQTWTAPEHSKNDAKEEVSSPPSASQPASQTGEVADSDNSFTEPPRTGKRLFIGTIQDLHLEHEYGVVQSAGVRHLHNRDPFVHLGQLTAEGEDSPMASKGDALIFALEQDEEDNLWTWEPIIPTTRVFTGFLRLWNEKLKVGQIRCEELMEMTGQDITVNSLAFVGQDSQLSVNMKISFCLTLNGIGRLQATKAKAVDEDERPAKKFRPNEVSGKGQKASSSPASDSQTDTGDPEARKKALQDDLRRKQAEELERAKGKEGSASSGAAVESMLDKWVAAKRQRDYTTADKLRDSLRAIGVNPDEARPWKERRW